MKYLIVVALLAGICAVARAEDVCHNTVTMACSGVSTFAGSSICNARYGGIDHVEREVQAYVNLQLEKSYEYLLLATHFNSYQKNRPGFQKLYQKLSDRSFEDAIDLIKQVTRRGGKVDFNVQHKSEQVEKQLEVDELHSLAIALDNEKELSKNAIHVHTQATHGVHTSQDNSLTSDSTLRDPEMAHYLEEKFLKSQAASVRQLSGYANDLVKFMKLPDPSLSVYLFDEYLQKQ